MLAACYRWLGQLMPHVGGKSREIPARFGARLVPLLAWVSGPHRPAWRYAKLAGYLMAVALLVAVGWRGRGAIHLASAHPWRVLGAVAAGAVSWGAFALGWAAISHSPQRLPAARTWVRTQLLRYLPGGVWAPAARARSTPRLRKGVLFVLAENALMVLAALLVASVALAIAWTPLWGLASATALALVVLALRRAGRLGLAPGAVLAAYCWYVASFIAFGGAMLLAQSAVGPVTEAGAVIGVACLAWIVGLLVITAPSGLGAREAAYLAMLSATMPAGGLAAGALTARACALVGEVLLLVALTGPPVISRWWRKVSPGFPEPVAQLDLGPDTEGSSPRDIDPDGPHLAGLGSDVANR